MTSSPIKTATISRRKLAGIAVAAALAGGAWTTSLAILSRGIHPQFFVIGEDAWQLVLVEHGQRRALLGLGEVPDDLEQDIENLTTSLRQHVDLVIGDAAFLDVASPMTSLWHSAVQVQFDGPDVAPSSSRHVYLRDRIAIGIGDFTLSLRSLPKGEWSVNSSDPPGWIGHLTLGSITVAMAASLDVANQHADPQSSLALAPDGDFNRLQRVLPTTGIVTNTHSVPDGTTSSTNTVSTTVVRTFRADVAAFRFRDDRIELPEWTQRIEA